MTVSNMLGCAVASKKEKKKKKKRKHEDSLDAAANAVPANGGANAAAPEGHERGDDSVSEPAGDLQVLTDAQPAAYTVQQLQQPKHSRRSGVDPHLHVMPGGEPGSSGAATGGDQAISPDSEEAAQPLDQAGKHKRHRLSKSPSAEAVVLGEKAKKKKKKKGGAAAAVAADPSDDEEDLDKLMSRKWSTFAETAAAHGRPDLADLGVASEKTGGTAGDLHAVEDTAGTSKHANRQKKAGKKVLFSRASCFTNVYGII